MRTFARVAYKLVTLNTGPTAPQAPCADKNDEACMSMSCPDILAQLGVDTKKELGIVKPADATMIRTAPASVVAPQYLAQLLASSTDDMANGEVLSEDIFSEQHFAGTAAIGSVIDSSFKVIGAEGLYVVDASALPHLTRINPMATIMAIGHLVGLHSVQEMTG